MMLKRPAAAHGDELAQFELGLLTSRNKESRTSTRTWSPEIGPMMWVKKPWLQTVCLQRSAPEKNKGSEQRK